MKPTSKFVKSLDSRVLDEYPPMREYLSNIGETPLIEVPGPDKGGRILAKCEWTNPNGTVKDRAVFGMVYRLLEATPLCRHRELHILEYTGGSLGLALSRVCASLELPLTLVLSSATDPAVVAEISRRGCDVVPVPSERGFREVMETAKRLATENPHWSFLYQHRNQANLWMHRETTGRELADELSRCVQGRTCAWVASIGTGGTLKGVQGALTGALPGLLTFATTPAEMRYGTHLPPNGLPKFLGSGGLGYGEKQFFIKSSATKVTGHMHYSYRRALMGMREFYERTGRWIGSSAAANWLAAHDIAQRLGAGSTVFTVFPSAASEAEWARVEALGCVKQAICD
jgi:cysteine synthase A